MTPNDPQQEVLEELKALRQRVAELEVKTTSRPARRTAWLGLLAASLVVAGVGTAFAASGACPNGMQYCFAANSPAVAQQINYNFSQLKEWLETKVGSTASATITSTGISNTGVLATTGNLNLNQGYLTGTNATGAFHVNSGANGSNNTLYLNWHGGTGGVIIGNGNSAQAAKFESNGNLVVTTVNGKRPEFTVSSNCSAGTCTASCTPGVVKSGWGFHGVNGTNGNVGGAYACGSAVQWLGACLGQTSCTVTTACGTSSLWLECW